MAAAGIEPASISERCTRTSSGVTPSAVRPYIRHQAWQVFHPDAFVESLRRPGWGLSFFQLLARPTLPRNLLLYVSMSISSSLTRCLDTTLTRLPLTVTRVRKVASTDPCLVFVDGGGLEPSTSIASCYASCAVLYLLSYPSKINRGILFF